MVRNWVIAPTSFENKKQFERVWEYCYKENIISIGFGSDIGDATSLTLDEIADRHKKLGEAASEHALRQIFMFWNEIKSEDRIIARGGRKKIVGVGTVLGVPFFDSDKMKEAGQPDHKSILPVRWDSIFEKDFPNIVFGLQTIYELSADRFEELTRRDGRYDFTSDSAAKSFNTESVLTPHEQMEESFLELNSRLSEELLESVKSISPNIFENLVVRLLEKMGYGEGNVVGQSGDGGIDGIINQDPLGLEKVYIQAKRWQNQVGEPEIRNFSGSLEAKGASKGVFITTSTFSSTAERTARYISAGNKFIRLIDGPELVRLMIDHSVGVVTVNTYEVKKIDENYFVDL